MELKIVNNTAFLLMDKIVFKCREGVRRGLLAVGPEIKREVVRLIKSPPKTGRYYVINGQLHQASAPGEAPANLTGNLAASVNHTMTGRDTLVIGDREAIAPYAKWLEGFVPNRIAPRPHLLPAVISKARDMELYIELAVRRELKG